MTNRIEEIRDWVSKDEMVDLEEYVEKTSTYLNDLLSEIERRDEKITDLGKLIDYDTRVMEKQDVEFDRLTAALEEYRRNEPPCKIGDTLFYNYNPHPKCIIFQCKVLSINIGSDKEHSWVHANYNDRLVDFRFSDFGKIVFLTEQSAKEALQNEAVGGGSGMSTHWLKVWTEYYDDVESGRKPFEVRIDNRFPRYEVGDTLILEDWDKDKRKYIGRECEKKVTYVLRDERFCLPEYCVIGLAPMEPHELRKVVFCRECKWSYLLRDRRLCQREDFQPFAVRDEHFCSYGETRIYGELRERSGGSEL